MQGCNKIGGFFCRQKEKVSKLLCGGQLRKAKGAGTMAKCQHVLVPWKNLATLRRLVASAEQPCKTHKGLPKLSLLRELLPQFLFQLRLAFAARFELQVVGFGLQ